MFKLSRLSIALVILLSGLALVPYAALPSERLQWQMFAGAYQPKGGTRVKIENSTFTPQVALVEVGGTVRWTNGDSIPHTITADNGAFDSGTLQPGESFEVHFGPGTTGAGAEGKPAALVTYTYHCSFHPSMTGQIMVVEKLDRVFLPLVAR